MAVASQICVPTSIGYKRLFTVASSDATQAFCMVFRSAAAVASQIRVHISAHFTVASSDATQAFRMVFRSAEAVASQICVPTSIGYKRLFTVASSDATQAFRMVSRSAEAVASQIRPLQHI